MERSSNVEQKGEAGRRGKRKFRVRRRGRAGFYSVNYSSSRQSNKLSTLPPPFPTWNAKTVAPTWCRKHNSRSLPLDASRRDAMIRRARSSTGIQSVQGWDNEETKLNFARDGKFYFQFKKKNSSGFNFPRKEISQQTIYFNSNVG